MIKKIKRVIFLRYENNNNFSQWHDAQFIDELSQYEISFKIFEFPKRGAITQEKYRALENLIRNPKSGDILLSCLFDDVQKDNNLFDLINTAKIPTVALLFDNLQVWFRNKKSALFYDIIWLTSMGSERYFKSTLSKVIYMPYAANPNNLSACQSNISHGGSNIVFIGNPYGARARYINALNSENIPLTCFGSFSSIRKEDIRDKHSPALFQQDFFKSCVQRTSSIGHLLFDRNGRRLLQGGLLNKLNKEDITLPKFTHLDGNKFGETVSQSKLVLNSAIVWNSHRTSNPVFKGHLRIFETAAFGGAQLIEAHDALEDWFDPGSELLTFDSIDELVDMTKFYLRPQQEHIVKGIKRQARARVLAEHTWYHRFSKLSTLL